MFLSLPREVSAGNYFIQKYVMFLIMRDRGTICFAGLIKDR